MIRLVALDIDGVLIRNRLSIFRSGHSLWLAKRPLLKRTILRIVELIEWLTKIKHEKNQPLVDFLNELNGSGVFVFLITDRSWLGLRNVWQEISGLHRINCIQIRGRRETRKKKDEIKNRLGIAEMEILISQSLKPRRDVLYSLAVFAKQKGIRSDEILIIDDDQNFLRVAKTFLGFRTFPEIFINNKEKEAKEIFLYLLARTLNRA